ncbi:MAG TPA: response regulator [Dissulfurispiraceae bacterium]|nr:response regulator [Dissulfurispiraceae bacterium]
MTDNLNARVLLVDDEARFVEILAERLRMRGVSVDTTTSGEAALKLVGEKSFDAVLLDLSMPGMGGTEVLREMKKIKPALQVIILTGQGSIQATVEVMKEGALDFMEKPVDINKLIEKLKEAVQKSTENI